MHGIHIAPEATVDLFGLEPCDGRGRRARHCPAALDEGVSRARGRQLRRPIPVATHQNPGVVDFYRQGAELGDIDSIIGYARMAQDDFTCSICKGQDAACSICKGTGWIEIAGAGMVDPAVFEAVGYDPEEFTGFAFGMDASLQINPYYGKTSERGLKEHFQRLLDLGPAIIYNVASRTGQDLQPELIESLAEHSNLVGVKECSGNERMGYYESKGIACWSGNDDQCFEGRHRHQSHGVISVIANLLPGLMRKLMDEDDPLLNERLQPMMSWLFHVPSPNALNTAMAMTGAAPPVFRLPYAPLDSEARQQGFDLLQAFTVEERVGSTLKLMDDSDFELSC